MRSFFISFCLLLTLAMPALAKDIPHLDTNTDADTDEFASWLANLRQEARDDGISQATIDAALTDIAPLPDVIELDQKQPETTITLPQYLQRIVSEKRIEDGKQVYAENRELLERISKEYGVQPKFIVALWGVESNFGQRQGDYGIVESLATLAYDGRRADFFRDELIKALKILDNGDITVEDMKGSWAGAMGQCQFMPSSYLNFAADGDGDGKRDIWNNNADVFASIANYLHSSGWDGNIGWGAAIDIPDHFSASRDDIKSSRTVAEWRRLGIPTDRLSDDTDAYVISVGDDASFMVTDNYKVLLKWNRSRYFATAVGMLADEIEP